MKLFSSIKNVVITEASNLLLDALASLYRVPIIYSPKENQCASSDQTAN
jgi:hypothetical protein